MANKYQEENDGIHLSRIIGMVPCNRHTANIGDACWNLVSQRGFIRAICDSRARAAGANGDVTPYQSSSTTRIKKKEHTR